MSKDEGKKNVKSNQQNSGSMHTPHPAQALKNAPFQSKTETKENNSPFLQVNTRPNAFAPPFFF